MLPQSQLLEDDSLRKPHDNFLDEASNLAHTAMHLYAADFSAALVFNPITGEDLASPLICGDIAAENFADFAQFASLAPVNDSVEAQVVYVEDIDSQPSSIKGFLKTEKIQTYISLKLSTANNQRTLARLYLFYRSPKEFDKDTQNGLQVFAQHAENSLRRGWYTYRYQEIVHVGQMLNQDYEVVKDLFKAAYKALRPLLDVSQYFMLTTYHPQQEKSELYLNERGQYRAFPNNPLNGEYTWALQTKNPLFIAHLNSDKNQIPEPLKHPQITDVYDRDSFIFVPLWINGMPLGTISVQHSNLEAFDHEDCHLLQLFGNSVAAALREVRLANDLKRLNETGQILAQNLESNDVLKDLVNQVQKAAKADLVILYPYQARESTFEMPPIVAGHLLEVEIPQPNVARPDNLAVLALEQSQPIFADDNADLYGQLRSQEVSVKGTFAKREQIQSTAVMPLHVVGELVGVLFINYRRTQHFDALTRQVILGLANQTAIAMKNARKFGSLIGQRTQELESLRKIDQQISLSLDLDTVLNTILRLASERIAFDKGVIFLFDKRTKELKRSATIGIENGKDQTIPLEDEKGITRWVFENKQSIRIDDVHKDQVWSKLYLEQNPLTRSELDAPLLNIDNEIIGVINLESNQSHAFSEADELYTNVLAGQAVVAITHAQTFNKEQHLLKERKRLHIIGQRIIRELDENRIFDVILEQALAATNSEAGTLVLYDQASNDLEVVVGRGVEPGMVGQRHSLDTGITGHVARSRELCNVEDVTVPPWNETHLPFIPDVRAELAVPMLQGNRLIGVINIESVEVAHFDETHENLLTDFADLAVIAIQNTRRYHEIKKVNEHIEALRNIDREIIKQFDDPEGAIQTVLKWASVNTGAEMAGLFLYEPDERVRVYRAHLDSRGEDVILDQFEIMPNTVFKNSLGIVRQVAQTQETYITKGDAQEDQYYKGDSNVHSEVAVPLVDDDILLGVLNIESPRLGAFTHDHINLLETFAGQTIIAIQNARNFVQAKQDSQRFEVLYQAAQQLSAVTINEHIDRVYDIITDIASEHIQTEIIIRRLNSSGNELIAVRAAHWDNPPEKARISVDSAYASAWVYRHQETLIIPDMENPPPKYNGVESADSKVRSLVNAAVQIEDNYYGNLAFTHTKANYFREDSEDVKLLKGLADQLAVTINRLETVDAQQEMEQRAREAEVMGAFGLQSFELAHRLGNDLGLVRSYLNNVKRQLQSVGVEDEVIEKNLQNVNRDVRHVLDLSTLLKEELKEFRHGDKPTAIVQTVSVRYLIEEVMATLINIPAPIQIHYEIPDTVAVMKARVIPKYIVDILYNVINNAIDAMPDKGKITVSARNGKRFIFISVIDTGIGIPSDKQKKIFGFLYTSKGRDGTGFGLWSARLKALQCGGELRLIESRPSRGSTFTLSIPKA